MNERIKQLVEKSKEYATESTKNFTGDEPIGFMDFYTEKFAELIVKEYETLLPEICPWDGPKDSPMKGWHVQFVARKHFGVK
jgi:hypothetical protein